MKVTALALICLIISIPIASNASCTKNDQQHLLLAQDAIRELNVNLKHNQNPKEMRNILKQQLDLLVANNVSHSCPSALRDYKITLKDILALAALVGSKP